MSENKEYIGIFKTSDVKINGKDYIAKIPAGGSELYTRAEAVERMAKVICRKDKRCIGGFCETCKSEILTKEYQPKAEAALSALLEDKQ